MREGCFSIFKIKSFNKEMILAQVFAWSSMEGAIMVVICLLDAIKSDAPFRVSSQWIFWYSSGVYKDISNTI